MLTIDTDLPKVAFRSPCNDSVFISYESGYVLSFTYQFVIDNINLVLNTPFIDALALPESTYIGRDV